jgi:hypothetical protein
MTKMNRAQREALFRVFCRQNPSAATNFKMWRGAYVRFRRSVQGGSDCVMVKWCNMWLGIELDGYTHS